MSQAIPTNVRPGKNAGSNSIYAQIEGGAIYKLNAQVPASRTASLIAQIEQAGVIKLQHWECVDLGPEFDKAELESMEKAVALYGRAWVYGKPQPELNLTDEDEWQMGCDSPMVEQMLIQEAENGVAS
jgi:hypothetical protein